MSSYTIIDSDTHVTETPELWTSRALANMRDRVPRIETGADGTQRWVLGKSKGMVLGCIKAVGSISRIRSYCSGGQLTAGYAALRQRRHQRPSCTVVLTLTKAHG